jgi:hypothetical protein
MDFEEVIGGLTYGVTSWSDWENREWPLRNSIGIYAQQAEILIRIVLCSNCIYSRVIVPLPVCFHTDYYVLIQEFTEFDKIEYNKLSLACNSYIYVYVCHFLITSVCNWVYKNKTDQSFSCMWVYTTYLLKIRLFLSYMYIFFKQLHGRIQDKILN